MTKAPELGPSNVSKAPVGITTLAQKKTRESDLPVATPKNSPTSHAHEIGLHFAQEEAMHWVSYIARKVS